MEKQTTFFNLDGILKFGFWLVDDIGVILIKEGFNDYDRTAILLATPKNKSKLLSLSSIQGKSFCELKKYQLLKLWPHKLTRQNYGGRETENYLSNKDLSIVIWIKNG